MINSNSIIKPKLITLKNTRYFTRLFSKMTGNCNIGQQLKQFNFSKYQHDRNFHGILITKTTPMHKCENCDAPFVNELTLLYHHKVVFNLDRTILVNLVLKQIVIAT